MIRLEFKVGVISLRTVRKQHIVFLVGADDYILWRLLVKLNVRQHGNGYPL